jgi:hypothetical protein
VLLVDEPIGVDRHARSRLVRHGIDLAKGFPVAHKPACVIVASRIVLGDEDVPSLRQLSEGRGVPVIRFLLDQERTPPPVAPSNTPVPPKPSSSNAATSLARQRTWAYARSPMCHPKKRKQPRADCLLWLFSDIDVFR